MKFNISKAPIKIPIKNSFNFDLLRTFFMLFKNLIFDLYIVQKNEFVRNNKSFVS